MSNLGTDKGATWTVTPSPASGCNSGTEGHPCSQSRHQTPVESSQSQFHSCCSTTVTTQGSHSNTTAPACQRAVEPPLNLHSFPGDKRELLVLSFSARPQVLPAQRQDGSKHVGYTAVSSHIFCSTSTSCHQRWGISNATCSVCKQLKENKKVFHGVLKHGQANHAGLAHGGC